MTRNGACPRGNQAAFDAEIARQTVESDLPEVFQTRPAGLTAVRACRELLETGSVMPAAFRALDALSEDFAVQS